MEPARLARSESSPPGRERRTGLRGRSVLHPGRAENAYRDWTPPDLIVSDGAYGVGGFPGDPRTPDELEEWYGEHVAVWSNRAHPATTLWFWNTEIGWATVHPLLAANGWEYVQTILWDKGLGHIAGNVNGDTIRRLPTVTEVCVFYRRRPPVSDPGRDGLRPRVAAFGMAANRNAAPPGQPSLRCEERGHPQVPDPGLALVLSARGDDGSAGCLRQRARRPGGAAVLLSRRTPTRHRAGMATPAPSMEPRTQG